MEIGQPVARGEGRGLVVPQALRGGRLQSLNAPKERKAATSGARCRPAMAGRGEECSTSSAAMGNPDWSRGTRLKRRAIQWLFSAFRGFGGREDRLNFECHG